MNSFGAKPCTGKKVFCPNFLFLTLLANFWALCLFPTKAPFWVVENCQNSIFMVYLNHDLGMKIVVNKQTISKTTFFVIQSMNFAFGFIKKYHKLAAIIEQKEVILFLGKKKCEFWLLIEILLKVITAKNDKTIFFNVFFKIYQKWSKKSKIWADALKKNIFNYSELIF